MLTETHYNSQTILDSLHLAVVLLDGELNIQNLNPSAETLFQISNDRASDAHVTSMFTDGSSIINKLKAVLESNHPFTEYDAQLHLQNNQAITMDYTVTPLNKPGTNKYLLLEFSTMVNHQKITKDENQLIQNAVARNLLRGMAHEIKNPLGGLRGAAQLLEREFDSEQMKEFTQIIIGEADRLKNLVDRILGPNDLPDKSRLNVHKVLEHVRQLVQAESKNTKFILDYDPSLPEVYADESMLIQAVLNITRNAVIAINKSGEITYRTRVLANYRIGHATNELVAKIDIIDNGVGIPEEIKDKIFFPMITSHAEGTGLGLSIAQTLIHQHDGLIEFSSSSGKTIFTILLPLQNR